MALHENPPPSPSTTGDRISVIYFIRSVLLLYVSNVKAEIRVTNINYYHCKESINIIEINITESKFWSIRNFLWMSNGQGMGGGLV